jgi:hypothetical protein
MKYRYKNFRYRKTKGDTEGVIRGRKSMKDRPHNGQKKRYKRANNDLQNIHKAKNRVTRTPLKQGVNSDTPEG